MMQMLQAGGLTVLTDDRRESDESNRKGYFEYAPVMKLRSDSRWLSEATGKVVKVIGPLLIHLRPGLQYRVIFMARPLSVIIDSQTKMLNRLNRKGAAISDRQLASTMKNQINIAKSELQNYSLVNALKINYCDAISDPEAAASLIGEFLGTELDRKAMVAVVDPTMQNEGKSQCKEF